MDSHKGIRVVTVEFYAHRLCCSPIACAKFLLYELLIPSFLCVGDGVHLSEIALIGSE